MALVEIDELTKVYKNGAKANDRVSLRLDEGEVFALLGPNGAGKTTLVRQLLTLTRPTSGSIRIGGVDVRADSMAARRVCSYQPQAPVPLEGVTMRQGIGLIGRLRGLGAVAAQRRAEQLIEALDVAEWADRRVHQVSGGLVRLLGFCLAVVDPGRLVVLDEPTNDVDPRRRRLLWEEVRRIADQGSAVLLVTHNVLEAERASDRLAIMQGGRVVASGGPAALKARLAGVLRLELLVEPGAALPEPPPPLRATRRIGNRLVIELPGDCAATAVEFAVALQEEGRVEEFSLTPASLEDAYLEATAGDRDAAPAAEVA